MRFPASFIEQLKNRLSVSDVIGKRLSLRKAGREFQALCPFHGEKTPSFYINDEKGFYHCFGCGAHGDQIRFLTELEKLDYPEAIKRLAEEAGIPLPKIETSAREAAREQKAQSLYTIMEEACAWFQKQLYATPGQAAQRYLAERGTSEAMVAEFRLGYAPDSREALKQHFLKKGVGEDVLVEAGLLIRPEGRPCYDRFRGRLIFPILDARGRVIAFGGRILGKAEPNIPKYLNSPETPLFHKGEVLFGLSASRAAAAKSGQLIVCEGYMDVIALHQAGMAQAVAPLGTALTESHLQLMWKLVPEPLLCLDGDAAGQRAMQRAARLALAMPALAPGKSIRFMVLPEGDDPDSLVKRKGPEAIQALCLAAKDLSDVLWDMALPPASWQSPEAVAAFEARHKALIEEIKHPGLKKHYQRFFDKRLWELGRAQPQKKQRTATRLAPGKLRQNADVSAEDRLARMLLVSVIEEPALIHESQVEEAVGHVYVGSSEQERLRRAMLEILGAEEVPDAAAFQVALERLGHGDTVQLMMSSKDIQFYFAEWRLLPYEGRKARAEALIEAWHDCAANRDTHFSKDLAVDGSLPIAEDSWERFRLYALQFMEKDPK
ncbi:MAG: DNA primase [Alphaproteobacteria bacterium]|nr:DNA primase [Alphaproteobacteria bacterium]